MSQQVLLKIELPDDLERFRLPRGVDERLHGLLDRQDRGEELTLDERREAEGLVDLAEILSLLKLRTQHVGSATIEEDATMVPSPRGVMMVTKTIELSEAQDRLADLVAQAATGTEIVLTEGNTPRARLVALAARRVPGLHPGSMEAAADFDAPLPDELWLGNE